MEPLVALLKDDIEKKVIKVDSDGADDALIKLGKPAVEPLIACLKDKNLRVRQTAAVVLAKLGDARGSEVLVSGLNDKNDQVQRDSAQALDELGDCVLRNTLPTTWTKVNASGRQRQKLKRSANSRRNKKQR